MQGLQQADGDLARILANRFDPRGFLFGDKDVFGTMQ